MCADRSQHPIVHFVGSIPLPDAETVFRTLSSATGRHVGPSSGRRDRHPQVLDPVSAGRARRESRDRVRQGRAAVQIRAMGRQGGARNPAPAHQARRHARPGRFQDRLCRHGDRILGRVRALAEGGRHPGERQVPDQHPDADCAHLQQHGAGRPAQAAAGADAVVHRRGREDRQGAAQRPHRDPMGCLPGGAGLGELLRPGAGRFPHRDHRRARQDRRRGAACDRAWLSPVLRQPGRRAHGAAQGRGHHGRDRSMPSRRR